MAAKETTEWDDILVEKGITQQQIEDIVDKVMEEREERVLKDFDYDELEELEDLEDEREIEKYRRARMKEIVESHNQNYGSLREISKSDYPVEVTKASAGVDVVVLLYQDSVEDSRVMMAILARLAEVYRAVKFLKIKADRCIENYPDKNVPTLLIYSKGELIQNIIGTSRFGGKLISIENVEIGLKGMGILRGGGVKSKFKVERVEKVQDDEDSDWD